MNDNTSVQTVFETISTASWGSLFDVTASMRGFVLHICHCSQFFLYCCRQSHCRGSTEWSGGPAWGAYYFCKWHTSIVFHRFIYVSDSLWSRSWFPCMVFRDKRTSLRSVIVKKHGHHRSRLSLTLINLWMLSGHCNRQNCEQYLPGGMRVANEIPVL